MPGRAPTLAQTIFFVFSIKIAYNTDMFKCGMLKKEEGISIIELIIVMSIIAILAAVAAPQYSRFVAKSRVKTAASDLLQNMRLARTIAIRENRQYLITVNENADTYSIGFDGDSNGSLIDAADGYENGPVRTIDLEDEYGANVVLDTDDFAVLPPSGPDNAAINNVPLLRFSPDGTISPIGSHIYLQYNLPDMGYTFCVEVASAVKFNLQMWRGDAHNPSETEWLKLK